LGPFHGRFRRVDEDDLIRPVAGDEGFLARKREHPTFDERVLAPADVAIGRTLTDSVTVPNVPIRTVFPPVLQRHHESRCDGQMIWLPTPRFAVSLSGVQNGHHLNKCSLPNSRQPPKRRIRQAFNPLYSLAS